MLTKRERSPMVIAMKANTETIKALAVAFANAMYREVGALMPMIDLENEDLFDLVADHNDTFCEAFEEVTGEEFDQTKPEHSELYNAVMELGRSETFAELVTID